MKKIILLVLFIVTLTACTTDNNHTTYSYQVVPVESYTVPDTFALGQTYEIKLKYIKPSSCHFFQGIYYDKTLNIRTIAIQTAVRDGQVCTQSIPEPSEVSFNFYVTNTGSYIFKFYKGVDADGKDIFEEVEIPVVN